MKHTILLLSVLLVCQSAPISKKKIEVPPKDENTKDYDWNNLHYEHYLTQVMTELEKDQEFGKRLKVMRQNSSMKTEDLATQLTFAKHSVRTRLDELKRLELKRLSELERRLDILKAKRGDKDVPDEIRRIVDRGHVDHENPSSFEIDDLHRLIKRAVSDLHVLDQKQKEEFKKHEMEKEILHKRKVKHIKNEKKKQEEENKWQESKERHNKHEPIHTPGSEEQLKEVWEKEDHLDPKDFDSRTFFKMHDLNGDGELEESEVEALLQKELDKAYNPNDPDDDMQERYENMMNMRENIMRKIDKNQDLRISFEELQNWTKSPEFKKDEGFKLAEEEKGKMFTDDDLKKYEQEYDKEHPDDMEDDEDDLDDHHQEISPIGEHHEKPHDGNVKEMKISDRGDIQKKDPGRKTADIKDHQQQHEPKPQDAKAHDM